MGRGCVPRRAVAPRETAGGGGLTEGNAARTAPGLFRLPQDAEPRSAPGGSHLHRRAGAGSQTAEIAAVLKSFLGRHPKIAASAFIEESAQVIGDVVIGADSSVWFNAVVRGDVHFIRIGRETNIQDGCVLHVYKDTHPLILGDRVTVAHAVSLHGCTIEDDCLIGIGAIVLNGVRLGRGSLVAAGAVVPEGMQAPPQSLLMGVPARIKRPVTPEETAMIARHAANYVQYKEQYRTAR